jgi:hypothetical protein
MAQWHLDELRKALDRKGWSVLAELDGNNYEISGSWEIQRSTSTPALHIDFEGLGDLKTLPMPQAYSCRLRENTKVGLYFSKQKTWKKPLEEFISALDSY